jgi:hypothetical protein
MTRCEACGRPPQSEIDAGKESLHPREIADQGCYAAIQALKAELDAKGDRAYTDAQAVAAGRRGHEDRELRAYQLQTIQKYDSNAAGKSAVDGVTAVPLSGQAMIDMKANAAKVAADMRAAWGL